MKIKHVLSALGLLLLTTILLASPACKAKVISAKQGDTVKVHYTGKLDDGTVFDTSTDGDPVEFTIGDGELLDGFEQAVIGMKPGEWKTVKIPMDDAYGPYLNELLIEVERNKFPADFEPEPGQVLPLMQEDGNMLVFYIVGVSDTAVLIDANHPLAGENLTFNIQLAEIIKKK